MEALCIQDVANQFIADTRHPSALNQFYQAIRLLSSLAKNT